MLAVEPRLLLAILERSELIPPIGVRLIFRETPEHVLAHDLVAVLDHHRRRWLVGIDVLDRRVKPAPPLFPFRPSSADELVVELGGPPVASTVCRLRHGAACRRQRPGDRWIKPAVLVELRAAIMAERGNAALGSKRI